MIKSYDWPCDVYTISCADFGVCDSLDSLIDLVETLHRLHFQSSNLHYTREVDANYYAIYTSSSATLHIENSELYLQHDIVHSDLLNLQANFQQ